MPDSIGAEDQARIQQLAKDVIDESIVPAYREFNNYFNETYLPASRESIGASALPNGENWPCDQNSDESADRAKEPRHLIDPFIAEPS